MTNTTRTHRIRCNACGDAHTTVADVRACYDDMHHQRMMIQVERDMEVRTERWFEERGA